MNTSITLSSGIGLRGLYDTLIHSRKANLAFKDQATLIEENKSPLQNVIQTSDSPGAYLSGELFKVAFEDEKSGQIVTVNLNLANMFNIFKNFTNKDNYFLRDDEIIRLNGDAERFVSGWFANVAYDLNFLAADKDKSAALEKEELFDTFLYNAPYLATNSRSPSSVTELRLQGGERLKFTDSSNKFLYDYANMELALNQIMLRDLNADNKISFTEEFRDKDALIAITEAAVIENGVGESSKGSQLLKLLLEKLKRMLEELVKEMKEKLDGNIEKKILEQGLAALNSIELEQFKSQKPVEFERLAKEDRLKETRNSSLSNEGFEAMQTQNENTQGLNLKTQNENLQGLNSNSKQDSAKILNLNSENKALQDLNSKTQNIDTRSLNLDSQKENLVNANITQRNTESLQAQNENLQGLNLKTQDSLNLEAKNEVLSEAKNLQAKELEKLRESLKEDLFRQIKIEGLKILDLRV